jgi:hypothetical protein
MLRIWCGETFFTPPSAVRAAEFDCNFHQIAGLKKSGSISNYSSLSEQVEISFAAGAKHSGESISVAESTSKLVNRRTQNERWFVIRKSS